MHHQWSAGQEVEAYDINKKQWSDGRIKRQDPDGSVTVELADGRLRKYKREIIQEVIDVMQFEPVRAKKPGLVEPVIDAPGHEVEVVEPVYILEPETDHVIVPDPVEPVQYVIDPAEDVIEPPQYVIDPAEDVDVVQDPDPQWVTTVCWDVRHTSGLGREKPDPQTYSDVPEYMCDSVTDAVERLNEDDSALEGKGICYLWSKSHNEYFLLWRSDKTEDVRRWNFVGLPGDRDLQSSIFWHVKYTNCLGDVEPDPAALNISKPPHGNSNSIRATIAQLNTDDSELKPDGICYCFSQSHQKYFLLWRSDKTTEVAQQFQIKEIPDEVLDMSPRSPNSRDSYGPYHPFRN